MKTFSELLTEYMRRTGVSDSEMARTLGVRRQTIFRWKEGLTERPRHRDDVLTCADKLRLTPMERDELLLAAGFSPDVPVVAPETIPAAPETITPPAPPLPTRRRKFPFAPFVFFAAFVFALFAAFAFYFAPIVFPAPYPIAAPGETLILVARFDDAAQPATPTPNPRLASPSADLTGRIVAALDREIQSARLEHVRVLGLSQPIRDARAAEDAAQRSHARIIVWGKFENDAFQIQFTVAPPASRADDLPLDALIVAPTEMPFKFSSDETQTPALVALAHLYLDRAEFDLAHATLTQIFSHPPSDAESVGALHANLGYVYQISKPPQIESAIGEYTQTFEVAPNAMAAYLNRGVAYLRENDAPHWQSDLNHAVQLRGDDVNANRALCWAYALSNDASRALLFCDAAVKLDSNARNREPRAIAYAELGRLNDATGDLQMFLNWLGTQTPGLRARYGTSRADWLESLKQNKNPFDRALLNKLRGE